MKESNELFDLCRRVYEATGWDDLADDHDWFTERGVIGYERNGLAPLYTSDYLLERLPKEIDRWILNGRYTFDWSFGYGSGLYFRNHSGSGDTPLKALLKLTLKLHEEGLL